jgi:hypothetical protein
MQFKVASRTADQLAVHKTELDAMFKAAVGADKKGRIDPKGLKELDANKFEIAELIVQLIDDTVALTDPIPFMVDRKDYGFGDQILFQEWRANLKVTKRAYGTKALSQRMTKTEYSMSTSHKELSVEIPLEEIAAGAIAVSDVINTMAESINRYRVGMVCDAIDAGVPSATADRTGVSGMTLRYTGLSATNLEKALDGLKDDGDAPTIFARHIALYPAIRAFTGWSQDGIREFETRGVTGVYQGSPIVTMVDRFSRKAQGHVIRKDRVYIASANKGAVMADVDVAFLNYAETDARAGVFTTGIRLEDGVLVWNPYAYRVIEV